MKKSSPSDGVDAHGLPTSRPEDTSVEDGENVRSRILRTVSESASSLAEAGVISKEQLSAFEILVGAQSQQDLARSLICRARDTFCDRHGEWLQAPHPKLGGRAPHECPAEALELLGRIDHGVFD